MITTATLPKQLKNGNWQTRRFLVLFIITINKQCVPTDV